METTILAEPPLAFARDDATRDFETLARLHGRFVFGVAFAVLRHREDAEDVAQETFLRALRSGCPDEIANVRAWLGRIAWRLALNRVRHRAHERGGVRSDGSSGEALLRTLPARDAGVEDELVRAERAELLKRVLQSLPRELREAFVLLTVREMTSAGAAEILGIPESSVRSRLMRARQLIKDKLAVWLRPEGRHP